MRLFRNNKNNAYRVLLHAQNVLAMFDDKYEKIGIYVTRVAQGKNEEIASNRAVEAFLREEKYNDIVLNVADDPPRVNVEEIEVISKDEIGALETGYSMYFENSEH